MARNVPGEPYTRISAEEGHEMVKAGSATVIDVRRQDEYEGGHVNGALWVPVDDVIPRYDELPKEGKRNVLAICPGFSSDCVETLEEIDIQGRESFLEKGGENFDLIHCLNDSSDHINLFEKLVKKYI